MYNNVVDEIRNRCNIVDVVGRVVPLKKAGSNYKGVCPFHNEKTPSFVVSEQKQIFTCFGCGASGDVIGFVMRYYNLDFPQAVEKLAGEYGIEIKKGFGRNEKNDQLYEINREAALFFHKAFIAPGNAGLEYMRKRGIDPATLKKFGIGYADPEWSSLRDYLNSKGYDDKLLLKLGLVSSSGDRVYDKFRDRVMFPIINTRGKVIGFGGRALGDAQPKYLNSPESEIFLKKNNLYGLNLTRQDIGKENCAILVEGYMDVISLYQSGVRNVSASLGTALTENQAALLKRYTDKVILSYDADEAGRAAALRGLEILHRANINVKVLHVTDGKDPDEFIKKKGREAFLDLTKNALPYADYRIENIKRKIDTSTTEGRVQFMKEAIHVLRALSPSAADIYVKKIAQDMKMSEGAIRMELYGNNTPENRDNPQGRPVQTVSEDNTSDRGYSSNPETLLEKTLIKMVLVDGEYYEKVKMYSYKIRNGMAPVLWEQIADLKTKRDDISIPELRELLENEERKLLDNILENVPVADIERIYEECVKTIELSELRQRESEINVMLSVADESENEDQIRELMEELNEIQKAKTNYGGLQ
ncbi:MAG: DNA primase [Clostridiales bacterium]|nr:DNA primase [Clostridiales bacterium]